MNVANGPLVGIVLVNYNGRQFMPDCLASLAKIDYYQVQVVVIDNASTDGSSDWVAEHYPQLPLLRLSTNEGITGGNNAGMTWCMEKGCNFILLLNNDTVVEPDFLSKLLEHTEQDALIVPKIFFYDNRTLLNSHVGHFDYWRGLNIEWFYERPDSDAARIMRRATMANTCAMLIPADLLKRVGLMDNNYFMYYDDNDFVTRAMRMQAKIIFVPDSIIYHRESGSSGGKRISPFTMYYLTRNRLYFMSKHQRNPFAKTFFLTYFFASRIGMLARLWWKKDQAVAAAVRHGIKDYFQGRMGQAPMGRFAK